MIDLYQAEFESPIGLIYLVSDEKAIRAVDFEGYEARMRVLLERHYGQYKLHAWKNSRESVNCLKSYFHGDLGAIEQLSVATNGTSFQRLVWAALRSIPVGTTVTYGTIAQRIGRPHACRAVGLANGSNPIGIVVPCHRVIGANANLTGYGGGLERKRWLLEHEGVGRQVRIL